MDIQQHKTRPKMTPLASLPKKKKKIPKEYSSSRERDSLTLFQISMRKMHLTRWGRHLCHGTFPFCHWVCQLGKCEDPFSKYWVISDCNKYAVLGRSLNFGSKTQSLKPTTPLHPMAPCHGYFCWQVTIKVCTFFFLLFI